MIYKKCFFFNILMYCILYMYVIMLITEQSVIKMELISHPPKHIILEILINLNTCKLEIYFKFL